MKKFFSLVLALVMVLSLTTVAWGAELEVGEGKTYSTIQAAVDAASSGDTIKVAAGTYAPFYIPTAKAGLTIEGTVEGGVNKTVVRTLYEGDDTIFASMRCGGIDIDAANITLKNLAIQSEGYTNGRWYAAPIGHYYERTPDRSGLTIEGCTITNMAASKSGTAICVHIADITLKNNVITGYDNGWYGESGKNLDTVVIEGNTFDVNSNAINFVNSGTPVADASVSISGNNFNNGNVLIWDYANTRSKDNSAIANVTLTGNTYGADSDVVLYDFKGGQADAEVSADQTPVETYSSLAKAVVLNPDATEINVQYGTSREATYTEQSNGTWLDENNTEYDANGDNPRTIVAKIGNTTYETIADAFKAVQSGDTVTLLDDITISEAWDCRSNGAKFTVPVTIDGNGHTLTFTGAVKDNNWNTVFRFEDTATVKNLTIDASAATVIQRGISAKGSITVENFTFIGNGSTAKYGVIFGEGVGSDANALSGVTVSVTGSTFKNASYGVSDNRNGQDAKSVTVTDSTFTNAKVLLGASESVTFSDNVMTDAGVNIRAQQSSSEMAVTATGNTLDADEVNSIVAETVTTDSNDFAVTGAMIAPAGYVVLKTTTGDEVVVPAVTMGDKFDLYLADSGMAAALKAKTPDVAGLSFTEVAAKTNKDGSGNVAYIAANNGQYFVKTTNPTVADYAVTDAGKTTVLYYVTVAGTSAANFAYEEAVTAFTNFSTYAKCGYVTDTPAAGKTYFMASDGKVYMAADAGTAGNYLLDGKVVSGVYAGTPEEHTFVFNGYQYDATKKVNVPTSALCTKCMMTTSSIYARTKVPATYTLYPTTGEGSVDYTVALPSTTGVYVPSAGTTTGPVIESAQTFDAGIAMYVGMSVMAACGSAVVIGKKRK